jgi:hypothetical protein
MTAESKLQEETTDEGASKAIHDNEGASKAIHDLSWIDLTEPDPKKTERRCA